MKRRRPATTEAAHVARYRTARRKEATARLTAATTAWRRLAVTAKLALAREIAETRGEELARACANVTSVGWGFIARRVRGRRKALREPCVKFFVPSKWEGRRKGDPQPGEIPTSLFAYATARGRRVLCAVPTDVEASAGIVAHAEDTGVTVAATEDGAMACIVKLPGHEDRYALSCRHVFGRTRERGDASPGGDPVTRRGEALSFAHRGDLRPEPGRRA